jgi:hypothetical protein
MDETAETTIRRELGPAERLLWCGRPRPGLMFRRADLYLVPFSLMWGGFAFFWEYLAFGKTPWFFELWGIPFVGVGIYLIAGRFFVDAKQREGTVYAVTNERVVILSGIFSRTVKSLNLRTLPDLTLDERADGSGTVTFGMPAVTSSWGAGKSWPGYPQTPGFELIPQARSVYDTIRKSQLAASHT